MAEIDDLDIPQVRLYRGPHKFIIADVSEGDKTKRILFGGYGFFHSDIVRELEEGKLHVVVRGGGRIDIDHDRKAIYLWDASKSYGAFEFDVAKKMIATEYEGYSVVNGPRPDEIKKRKRRK